MSLRGESGWQSEKSLSECMCHMLENEIATDVSFEVGPPDGATVNIRAHKYMLISRSPVFEAMFSSGMAEYRSRDEAKIRVEDIDSAVFKDLLRYIYYDIAPVNVETATSLMYAAKKYLLPKLVKECGKCLSEGLNVTNVIHVLEQSLSFDESDLKSKCVPLIIQNAKAVLTGKEIMSASLQTMEFILQMDKISVKETVIYETCLAWAKHQLLIQRSTENPTDQQIREMLGNLLHKIRFPIMDQTEFSEICEGNKILTGEEKASIYYFLATKKKGHELMFSTERRGFSDKQMYVHRTLTWVAGIWTSTPKVDAINFTTNQDVMMTGIALYTGFASGYNADVEVMQSAHSLFKKKVTVPITGSCCQFNIFFDEPIFIQAGVLYSVKSLSDNSIGHYGRPCQPVCTAEGVTFTFSKHPESHVQTSPTEGQIPVIYFRCFFNK